MTKSFPQRRSCLSALITEFQNYLPWASFIAGIGGSLHCVGMCGGLVTSTCNKNQDIIRYQLGRLLGYLTLGLSAGFLGSLLKLETASPIVVILPGLMIGLLFLYWGIQNFKGKKAELPMPKFMGKIYTFLWKKLVFNNMSFSKSFFTGLISIFLPCGLLYGMVLGGVALQHPLIALASMFFFWLGTLPSMVLAPQIFQKIMAPFKSKLPRTYAVSLIVIGLMTISFRVVKFEELQKHSVHASGIQSHSLFCH